MGKLQSKHAYKRRENPEGDAFKEVACSEELDRNKQDLCVREAEEDHLSDHYCSLQVTLPPQRLLETSESLHSCPENGRQHPQKDTVRRSGKTDEKECNVSITDENQQEWMITLYDLDIFGIAAPAFSVTWSIRNHSNMINSFIHFLVGLVPLLIWGRHSGMNHQLIQHTFYRAHTNSTQKCQLTQPRLKPATFFL
ncbi:naked cuticle-like protein 3 isoform X4 [Danio rerio]|uniref:Naked cuticle-like protein 3 isoform X4 n=1 Tax=Danio rerio TaxID=7955 RepID=A0AC58HX84_DANRE